jgi:hypothetical protein
VKATLSLSALFVLSLAVSWTLVPRVASSHGSVTTTVLFDREIVRILESRCVSCHMDGGIAFPLSTYEETWLRGRSIRTEVLRRHMPPWPAVSGYGEFANDNGLTLRESQFMVAWVEGLGPRNAGTVFLNVSDPKAVATREIRATAHVGHWQLGQPDLTRPLEPSRIDARQGDGVRRSIIDLGLTSDLRIRALEYLPSDRRVVRAVVFTLQQTGQWLGSWTPWYGFTKMPENLSVRVPPGGKIVADVYYRGAEEPVVDRGTVGLYFADRAVSFMRGTDVVLQASRDVRGTFRSVADLNADTRVWALQPAIDGDVTSLELSARRNDGGTEVLLYARDAAAAWPTPFILKQPVLLRKGTQLSFTARLKEGATPSAVKMIVARF